MGERIAIGELSKYGLEILLPMGDNLPFDFVVYTNNKFYKCQVKTTYENTKNGSCRFSLTSNNWATKKVHKYNNDEVDVIICCDLKHIYLFSFSEVKNKSNIFLRDEPTKNGQVKGINLKKDYILTEERILKIFSN